MTSSLAEHLSCLSDPTLFEDNQQLSAYADTHSITYSKEDLDALIKDVESQLENQLWYLSYLQYASITYHNDWGHAGRYHVQTSYIQLCLRLNIELTDPGYMDDDAFQTHITAQYQAYQIDPSQIEVIDQNIKDFEIRLWGFTYAAEKASFYDHILTFIGSRSALQCGRHGSHVEFILGEGKREKKKNYTIVLLDHERVRSPYTIIPMAAVIGYQSIFIRLDAIKSIFSMKWTVPLSSLYPIAIEDKVSLMIRKSAVKRYEKNKKNNYIKRSRQLFLSDLTETVTAHEIGHGISQHEMLPFRVATYCEASLCLGEHSIGMLLECCADFAPRYGQLCGPLANMVEISKEDQARAERMFFAYFSDIWFFDTEDQHMYVYSDVIAMLFLFCLRPNSHVDFDRLNQHLQPEKKEGDCSFLEKIMTILTACSQVIETALYESQFCLNGHIYDYHDACEQLTDQIGELTDPYQQSVLLYSRLLDNRQIEGEDLLQKQLQDQAPQIRQQLYETLYPTQLFDRHKLIESFVPLLANE